LQRHQVAKIVTRLLSQGKMAGLDFDADLARNGHSAPKRFARFALTWTARKQGIQMLQALRQAFLGEPLELAEAE
jgi:hypothetical protein